MHTFCCGINRLCFFPDDGTGSGVNRSSSFQRKHLEEQDLRQNHQSYELSSDIQDKQIEVLRVSIAFASAKGMRLVQTRCSQPISDHGPLQHLTEEHAPLKFLKINYFIMTNVITDIFNNKHRMIFENNTYWYMYKLFEGNNMLIDFFCSIAKLKCTPSNRQVCPLGLDSVPNYHTSWICVPIFCLKVSQANICNITVYINHNLGVEVLPFSAWMDTMGQ